MSVNERLAPHRVNSGAGVPGLPGLLVRSRQTQRRQACPHLLQEPQFPSTGLCSLSRYRRTVFITADECQIRLKFLYKV